MSRLIVSLFLVCSVLFSAAQESVKPAPAAKESDVKSSEAIVAALYDVISGPAGKRDWDRMRSLFTPEARLIAVGRARAGQIRQQTMTVEDYIRLSGPFLEERGFFEKEVYRKGETYLNIAHVFSSYESRAKADDAKPFERGVNSFQLMNDGKRWWIVTIYWQGEPVAAGA